MTQVFHSGGVGPSTSMLRAREDDLSSASIGGGAEPRSGQSAAPQLQTNIQELLAGFIGGQNASASSTNDDGLKTEPTVHQRVEAVRLSGADNCDSSSLFSELRAEQQRIAASLLAQEARIDHVSEVVREVASHVRPSLVSRLSEVLKSNQTSLEISGQDFFNLISAKLAEKQALNGFSRILNPEDYRKGEVQMIAVAMGLIDVINDEIATDQGITKRLRGTLVNELTPTLITQDGVISGRLTHVRTGFSFKFEFVDSSAPVPHATGRFGDSIPKTEPLASDLREYVRANLEFSNRFDTL